MTQRSFFHTLLLAAACVSLSQNPGAAGQFPPGPGGPGQGPGGRGGPMGGPEQKIVGQFDADKNGRLDAAERKAALAFI